MYLRIIRDPILHMLYVDILIMRQIEEFCDANWVLDNDEKSFTSGDVFTSGLEVSKANMYSQVYDEIRIYT